MNSCLIYPLSDQDRAFIKSERCLILNLFPFCNNLIENISSSLNSLKCEDDKTVYAIKSSLKGIISIINKYECKCLEPNLLYLLSYAVLPELTNEEIKCLTSTSANLRFALKNLKQINLFHYSDDDPICLYADLIKLIQKERGKRNINNNCFNRTLDSITSIYDLSVSCSHG